MLKRIRAVPYLRKRLVLQTFDSGTSTTPANLDDCLLPIVIATAAARDVSPSTTADRDVVVSRTRSFCRMSMVRFPP